MKDLLILTPPFTQLNTPYPASAYIKGFLKTKGISSFQMDLGIEVILALFSKKHLSIVFDLAEKKGDDLSENAKRIIALKQDYLTKVEPVVKFLQGKQQTMARLIVSHDFLPRGARFAQLDDLEWAFGNMGMQDKAKHLGTMFLEDLSDLIVEAADPNFGFSRYAERLGMSANSFDELYDHLQSDLTLIDRITIQILKERIEEAKPKLVCISVPFPGNLYSAFRCAQYIKTNHSDVKIAMGGGFANTELRSLSDPRVFEFFDFISLDDGELPLEIIVSNVLDPSPKNPDHKLFKRTFVLEDGKVFYNNLSLRKDYTQLKVGTPDYSDLLLDQYISVIEIANPMHSLWSDGRWNKLTMAHGCYWGKCTFCDISLDYIKNYEPIAARVLVDRMEEIIKQTGETGFHFVDEAAPPALMRQLAIEILKRGLIVTWWTNIRFEKNFSFDLCRLLKSSGCIAISGGLEVASDRLLALIDKGVTVAQVAHVTRNFTEAGIMVHAYLMYGYPTQTIQETIDSLEMVRQLFEIGVLQSGFWHQFALTAHSPIGIDPDTFGVVPKYEKITFANNDIQFEDNTGIDHNIFSYGLKKSLFNYMHGMCFDFELQEWFDFEIPSASIHPEYIVECLDEEENSYTKETSKILWIGSLPKVSDTIRKRKGIENQMRKLDFYTKEAGESVIISIEQCNWILWLFENANADLGPIAYARVKTDYQEKIGDFDLFWYGNEMDSIRNMGLLIL